MPQKSDVHIQSDKTGEDGNIDSKMSHEMNQPVGTGSTGRRHVPQTQEKVSRPIPESQKADPRQYQLNQLRRRFSLEEKEEHDATSMTFRLVPTDPDFPFEISDGGLLCLLKIPHSYPARGLPSMHVSNPDMARGYQINVERGFDSLVKSMPNSTLLGLINEFDKRLEGLLVHEKAPTIKIVTNTTGKKDVRGKLPVASATSETEKLPVASAIPETSQPSVKAQHTPQQLADAKSKRESDIRQLEARMSRVPLFSKSSDGVTFSVPLQILKSSKLPIPLQPVQSVKLLVPLLYNLEPCSILLVDAPSKEADAVQTAFERHARAHPEMTLMAHINFLAQNMRSMATEGPPATTEIQSLPPAAMKEIALDVPKDENTKSHIQVIPRPPEWDTNLHDDSGTDSSEDESSEYDTNEDDGGAALPPETQTPTASGPDLGILLSFPSLELYGAELLQLHSISLTVKCDRCKEMKDVKNVRSHASGESSLVKHESCNKCANALSIGL